MERVILVSQIIGVVVMLTVLSEINSIYDLKVKHLILALIFPFITIFIILIAILVGIVLKIDFLNVPLLKRKRG